MNSLTNFKTQIKVMIKKQGFLLIELLVALFIFTAVASISSYFIYINLYTRNITLKRVKSLNSIVNFLENKDGTKNINTQNFNIKVTKEGDFFCFKYISKSFYDFGKRKHNIKIIGPT